MAETKRKRTVRSVTLDDDLVERIKAVGAKMVPKESNLSRLLDRAMADFVLASRQPRRKGRQ